MGCIVITGSSRGFGLKMAEKFRELGKDVVISATNPERLKNALEELLKTDSPAKVLSVLCNVTKMDELENLYTEAEKAFGSVEMWINNAGVNQPDKPVCELTDKEIDFMLETDLKGTIYGSRVAFSHMKEKGGQIYNVEGYGSNDAMMTGLTIYGTTKRAVTYFTKALAKESMDVAGGRVLVSRLTPGIMITDFIKTANGGRTEIELPEKTKKVYNILGDYPQTIADYVVPRMLKNKKNNGNVVWLTTGRAFRRFLFAGFNKRDFFKEDK